MLRWTANEKNSKLRLRDYESLPNPRRRNGATVLRTVFLHPLTSLSFDSPSLVLITAPQSTPLSSQYRSEKVSREGSMAIAVLASGESRLRKNPAGKAARSSHLGRTCSPSRMSAGTGNLIGSEIKLRHLFRHDCYEYTVL